MPQAAKARTVDTEAQLLADLLRRRYRQNPPATEIPWNTAIDAILDHRTARAYLPDALPAGTLELLAAAAQSAPTPSQRQLLSTPIWAQDMVKIVIFRGMRSSLQWPH